MEADADFGRLLNRKTFQVQSVELNWTFTAYQWQYKGTQTLNGWITYGRNGSKDSADDARKTNSEIEFK